MGILQYAVESNLSTNFENLSEPILPHETQLMAFAFSEPYESSCENGRMPMGSSDREFFLVNTQERTNDGLGIRWVTNNATLDMNVLMHFKKPLLFEIYDGNLETLPMNVTYTIDENDIVDIVLQNTVALDGKCESHPFHLHGHKVWIHSYGSGLYNSSMNNSSSTSNPALRDSVMLYASEYAYFHPNRSTLNHRKPCGWTKIRFISDNPGLWLLHCHIGAHALMGMNVLIKESTEKLSMEYFSKQ